MRYIRCVSQLVESNGQLYPLSWTRFAKNIADLLNGSSPKGKERTTGRMMHYLERRVKSSRCWLLVVGSTRQYASSSDQRARRAAGRSSLKDQSQPTTRYEVGQQRSPCHQERKTVTYREVWWNKAESRTSCRVVNDAGVGQTPA